MGLSEGDEADGAWSFPYRNGAHNGSGTTPSLMGFGPDEDHFLVFGAGDEFVLGFSRATDRGGVRGGKQYVDSLFEFSLPVGDDYSGEWVDSSSFATRKRKSGCEPR